MLIIADVKYADFTSGMKNLPLWNTYSYLEKKTISHQLEYKPMWITTYHNGYVLDGKCYGHTTSPLVTSVGTRCEKSISTDVKCHFCSSVDSANFRADLTASKKKNLLNSFWFNLFHFMNSIMLLILFCFWNWLENVLSAN